MAKGKWKKGSSKQRMEKREGGAGSMQMEVRTEVLNNIASDEREMRRTLRGMNEEIEECRLRLKVIFEKSSVRDQIDRSLERIHTRMADVSGRIGNMGEKLGEIARLYVKTEKTIVEQGSQKNPG